MQFYQEEKVQQTTVTESVKRVRELGLVPHVTLLFRSEGAGRARRTCPERPVGAGTCVPTIHSIFAVTRRGEHS